MITTPPKAILGRRQWLIAGTVALVATVWLVILSGWLGVVPGSPFTMRRNVLFDSDMNVWVDRMTGNDLSLEQSVHPLEIALWRRPCRAVEFVAARFVSSREAALLAPRILVALFAGMGVGFLALLALYVGVRPLHGVLLLVIYLLFTSNTTICLPEHFGITSGILAMTFVGTVLIANRRIRMTLLAVSAVVLGGTSLANGLFPLGCMFDTYFKSTRVKVRLAAAGAILVLAGLAAGHFFRGILYRLYHGAIGFTSHFGAAIHDFVVRSNIQLQSSVNNVVWFYKIFAVYRWTRHPLTAMVYAVYMFVQPAVAPSPDVLRNEGHDMVSYEPDLKPLQLSYYFGLQGIGAVAWLILLSTCTYFAWQDEKMRPYLRLLFAWIAFNVFFYNIWGRELILWAPAWSWALMTLVLLGAPRVSWKFIAALFIPIVVSQIYTLGAIKSALLTIIQ